MATLATHIGDPHGDPQTSPQHAVPHGLLVSFSFKRPQVHVDRRVVGWSAGRHVDHPCGWQTPWPPRKFPETTTVWSGFQQNACTKLGQASYSSFYNASSTTTSNSNSKAKKEEAHRQHMLGSGCAGERLSSLR